MELIYTKFVSLIASEPTIQTLLPLTPQARSRARAPARQQSGTAQAHPHLPATRAPACPSAVSEQLRTCYLHRPGKHMAVPRQWRAARHGLQEVCCSARSEVTRGCVDPDQHGNNLTMVPAAQGEICDIDGRCVDAAEDEVFKLTTKGGKLAVEVEKARPVPSAYPTLGFMTYDL